MASLTRRQFLGVASGSTGWRPATTTPNLRLPINPRGVWATDRASMGPSSEEDVRFLIVHHSASNNGHSGADAPAILRGFYDFHTGPSRGWNDIAYNFLIDSDGGVWEGRQGSLDGPVAGDATGGNQGFTQLVCLIGDFETAQPSEESLESLVALLAWLADRYDVPTTPGAEVTFTSRGSNRHPEGELVTTPTITGHRTMSETSCPGENLNSYVVAGLMADVHALRMHATTSSTTSTTAVTTTTSSPTTTSLPDSTTSTSRPDSTTSTSEPAATTSTLHLAAGEASSVPAGIITAAGAAVLTLGGLLVWRRRRMSG